MSAVENLSWGNINPTEQHRRASSKVTELLESALAAVLVSLFPGGDSGTVLLLLLSRTQGGLTLAEPQPNPKCFLLEV